MALLGSGTARDKRAPGRRILVRVSRTVRAAVLLVAAFVALATLPRLLLGRDGGAYFDGELATQDRLARTVASAVLAQRTPTTYHTGDLRFDGQSTIAIDQMALLGLGQILLEHPEKKEAYLPAMRAGAERLVAPATLAYAAKAYGAHGVLALGSADGHAYLGYINLGLGMLRLADPHTPLASIHDRITEALARRIDASAQGMIETYPRETWPPDVAAVVGSIGLHARATGVDRGALLARWAARFEPCAVDASGLLVQRVATGSCRAVDAPRGSGTAVAAYFLSFATPALARKLYDALVRQAGVEVLGLGGIREYAPGHSGRGDLNAGPILFGISVGATGFALGAARAHGDRDRFVALHRSADLFGIGTSTGDRATFAAGGVLGNALLLAMLTAARPEAR